MTPPFQPLFKNAHLATIAGNFWSRPHSNLTFPVVQTHYKVDSNTTVVALNQVPLGKPRGHLVVLHGLEGSANAGYNHSLAHLALQKGYSVHRLNLRTCGGTEALCTTMYHSGLSTDIAFVIREISSNTTAPIFLVGYSLGGNIALKLAGEYGQNSPVSSAIAISAPIDLARCVQQIDKPANRPYARRFLNRLRSRIRRKSILSPESYSAEFLNAVHSIWQFDDRYTARLFGFGNAANYYATQSAINYMAQMRCPTLLIAAKDDPLVPFEIYDHPAIQANPAIRLVAPEHGGHVGFLSRTKPRFWVDHVVMNWIQSLNKA